MAFQESFNIHPYAQHLLQGSLSLDALAQKLPSDLAVSMNRPLTAEEQAIFAEKAELYALSGIFIDQIIKEALFRKSQGINPTDPRMIQQQQGEVFEETLKRHTRVISLYCSDAVEYVVDRLDYGLKSQPDSGFSPAYARFQILLNTRSKRATHHKLSIKDFFKNGMATAVSTTYEVTRLVPFLYQREQQKNTDGQSYLKIAKNSKSLVARLAMLNIFVFDTLDQQLRDDNERIQAYELDYFKLKHTENNSFVVFNEVIEKNIIYLEKLFSQYLRLGCPGMIDFGEGSAVSRLYDWGLEAGEKAYSQHF